MKFLVFELLSADSSLNVKPALLMEGISMLNLISTGLQRAGHDVYTLIDDEYLNLVSVLNPVRRDGKQELLPYLEDEARDLGVDYVYPVAPDRELAETVSFLNSRDIETVSSEADAIGKTADKWKTYKILNKEGIPQPETYLDNPSNPSYPLVVKSRFGVGCENLYLVDSKPENDYRDAIVQEYIDGFHCSVSLFSNGEESKAVSLNEQYIKLSGKGSEYIGGKVLVYHPLREEAFTYAEKAVNSIKGLKGCLGVDLVIADKTYVIEINPRVTTSMTALEKASGMNIAETSYNAFQGELPVRWEINKQVEFIITDTGLRFNESAFHG